MGYSLSDLFLTIALIAIPVGLLTSPNVSDAVKLVAAPCAMTFLATYHFRLDCLNGYLVGSAVFAIQWVIYQTVIQGKELFGSFPLLLFWGPPVLAVISVPILIAWFLADRVRSDDDAADNNAPSRDAVEPDK
ncbi:MAG: hypothetical protein SGJ20_18210 [Planctomycetota bacterium]|nr:hypothetical protein [Planctomycetota bacterium]